jgi:hypothetical protein
LLAEGKLPAAEAIAPHLGGKKSAEETPIAFEALSMQSPFLANRKYVGVPHDEE